MFALSAYGGFPDRLHDYEINFYVDHIKSDAVLASLKLIPTGYECDEKGIYGIYIHGHFEQGNAMQLPTGGDFIHPEQFRDLRALISSPNTESKSVQLVGEIFQLEFKWQDDDRLRLSGTIGTAGWGKSYLERLFAQYPFRVDLNFACSFSRKSLVPTLDELTNLLQFLDDDAFQERQTPNTCRIRGQK